MSPRKCRGSKGKVCLAMVGITPLSYDCSKEGGLVASMVGSKYSYIRGIIKNMEIMILFGRLY